MTGPLRHTRLGAPAVVCLVFFGFVLLVVCVCVSVSVSVSVCVCVCVRARACGFVSIVFLFRMHWCMHFWLLLVSFGVLSTL